ncbi:hypothetical protein DUGA2_64870 [Duganella sp. HH101]|nr:hypothetical protein DUGA2_64870 [Duganella sp. HH101]
MAGRWNAQQRRAHQLSGHVLGRRSGRGLCADGAGQRKRVGTARMRIHARRRRAARGGAGSRAGQRGWRHRRAAGIGTPSTAGGVERHGVRLSIDVDDVGVVRGMGGIVAGQRGARARRRTVDVCRAQCASEPPGASPAHTGRGPGRAGGPVRGAFAGDGGSPAGHPEGRRRLCAAGPGLSGRPPGLHAGGRGAGGAADPATPAGLTAGQRSACIPAERRRGVARCLRRHQSVQRRLGRQPGLCDLYIRLDRQA